MTKESFISFSDFKSKLLTKETHEQSIEDMIRVCRLLNAAYGGEEVITDG